jgi:hypothetical protein
MKPNLFLESDFPKKPLIYFIIIIIIIFFHNTKTLFHGWPTTPLRVTGHPNKTTGDWPFMGRFINFFCVKKMIFWKIICRARLF